MQEPLGGADPSFRAFQGIGNRLGGPLVEGDEQYERGPLVECDEQDERRLLDEDYEKYMQERESVESSSFNTCDESKTASDEDEAPFTDESVLQVIGQYATLVASWAMACSETQFASECDSFVLQATMLMSVEVKHYSGVKEIIDMFAILQDKKKNNVGANTSDQAAEGSGTTPDDKGVHNKKAPKKDEPDQDSDQSSDSDCGSQGIEADIDHMAKEEGLTMLTRPKKRFRGKAAQPFA